MKPPPDEKTIETLREATQGRRARSKWRVALLVVLVIVLALGGIMTVFEAMRRTNITDARNAVTREVDLTADRYADVNDWGEWYRRQLPANCDTDGLPRWIEAATASGCTEGAVADWANDHPLYTDETSTPSEGDLRKYLDESEPLVLMAQELRAHKRIALLPLLDDGAVHFDVLETLKAFKVLNYRTVILQYLGDRDVMWPELVAALELLQKWDHPLALVQQMVRTAMEHLFHDRFAELVGSHTPPTSVLQWLVPQPKVRFAMTREMMECELAFFAQITKDFDPDDEQTWAYLTSSGKSAMFDYLSPSLTWKERKEAFAGKREILHTYADYLSQLRSALELPHGDVSNLSAANWMLESFHRLPPLLLQTSIFRQQTSLACTLLLAREANELDSTVARLAKENPDFEFLRSDKQVQIRLRYSEALAKRLPDSLEEDEFSEVYEPIDIPR